MSIRAQPVNLLLTGLCVVLFILANYYFFFHSSAPSSFTLTRSNRRDEGSKSLDSIWDYRLNLTSLFVKLTPKEIDLFHKLKSIRASCGQVCDTSVSSGIMGKYYEQLHKEIRCEPLFTNPDIDALSQYDEPPKKIPTYLLPEFTHGGKWEVVDDWRNDANGVTHQLVWTKDDIEGQMKLYRENQLQGNYGQWSVQTITNHFDNYVPLKDKMVLVIGSQNPWLEAMILSKGAKFITTFDYVQIDSQHPQIETITPEGLSKKFFDGVRYDVVVTYSSIEHSGLGRYGDMLNPWGDLIAMARSWCLVKPGGFGVVGVPTGPDRIGFNSHKIYGPLAYAQLFSNWEQIYTDTDWSQYDANGCWWCYQPVHTLRRI